LISAAVITACAVGVINSNAAGTDRILGDMNGDEIVDISDALMLFQHCMLPDVYSIDYPGTLDLDKSGIVDIRDAMRLFQYSMLPNMYPIEWEGGAETEKPETEFVTDDPTEVVEYISMADLSSYTIVRPKDASKPLQRAGVTLRNKLKLGVGIQLELRIDNSSDTISECEILVGRCDREESRQFAQGLMLNDYGYTVIGKKLVICGGSEEATVEAVNAFIEAVIQKYDGTNEIFFSSADAFMMKGTYENGSLTLQGTGIGEYSIVYAHGEEASRILAEQFVEVLSEKTGHVLTIRSDAEPASGKEILLGSTNRSECSAMTGTVEAGTCVIGAEGDYVYARGTNCTGNYYAMWALVDAMMGSISLEQNVVLESVVIKEVPMEKDNLTAMSFNVYYSDLTEQRMESVKQTILNYLPDTVGIQEAVPEWMDYLDASLGGIYAHVGLGREGGSNGEHSAIFYKRDRFELIETGTKWLSKTPDSVSKFEESSLFRIVTYALLQDKTTGEKILVANTHLDHTNSKARDLQVAVLLEILEEYREYPIVLTGDFNTSPGSNAYRIVTEELTDSSKIAETADEHGTYGVSVIDYAFVSKENINVVHYQVITEDANGIQPSDHNPVLIEYTVLP